MRTPREHERAPFACQRAAHPPRRAHVLDPEDEAAFFDFAHAERPWRDLLCVRACFARERLHEQVTYLHPPRRHDVAAGLGLHSETNEDAEGERFVTVRKARQGAPAQRASKRASGRSPSPPVLTRAVARLQKPLIGAMARPTAAELQQLARKQAPKQARPKLSDAPPPPDALQAVVRLNVKKRDLRTIEEVQLDMKAKKEPRMEDGGAP